MSKLINRIFTSLFLLFLIIISLKNHLILLSLLIIISFFSLSEFYNLFKKIFKKKKFINLILIFISLIYIVFFTTTIWFFLNSTNTNNISSMIYLLTICISTDIGGFVFGKIIGGKKLTKISPKKTYSGAVGSIIFSLIFGHAYLYFLNPTLIDHMSIILFILLISITSQVGDLIISFLKRKANTKDTGYILPGHGGILDRIDGMLLALPLGIIFLST